MATQHYSPQPVPPPSGPRATKFAPALGLPEIVALNDVPGELAPSEFGASEVKFKLTDGRTWYVPQIVADQIYRAGVTSRQQIEVTKVGRMKHELQIIPLQAHLNPRPVAAAPPPPVAHVMAASQVAATPSAPALSPDAHCMMAAMCAAVDAVMETQAYASRKGLGLTFSEESVRAIGLSIYISACKGGR